MCPENPTNDKRPAPVAPKLEADEPTTAQLLADAVQAHRRNNLTAAQALYEAVLRTQPQHPDALHLLGVTAYQSQRPDLAVDLIRQALDVYEENAAAHVNLGLALQSLDQNEEARASFERATTIDPSNVGAWLGLGNVLTRLARNDPARRNDAIASFERVIALQPDHTFALHQLGVLHLERGDVEDALRSFDAALQVKPDLAEAWNNRGNALVTLGRREEAVASFNRALAIQPDLHFALQNRGILRAYLGDAHGALQDFDAALDQQNMTAQGYCGRGSALLQLQRFTDALSSFQQALSDEPENVEARLGQARSLSSLKRYSEALEVLESAVLIAPRNSEVLTDRAFVLLHQQRYDEALTAANHALSLYPAQVEALNIRGMALQALGKPEAAMSSYEHALSIDPDHAEASFNASLLHLQRGEYLKGWAGFESRWRCARPNVRRHADVPVWSGLENITAKRLLIWADEGFGDTIQFCRYASALRARGVDIVLEVQPPLKALVTENFRNIQVIARGETPPACDFAIALLSLPDALKIESSSIPYVSGYLRADPQATETWRRRLQPARAHTTCVGIAVSGNPEHGNDRNRSASLASFTPLLAQADVFVIQKGLHAHDAAYLASTPSFQYLGDEINDFSDLAAIIANLDLVISVDTATAHLAAAMGKPTWLLLPVNCDWRWQLERDDSPWYPSVRLFRQRTIGDWPDVIKRVCAALSDMTA
jgi:tetratricopeptide (TPR) repeat protein